jgi:serine/threonine-protein kinase
MIPTRLGRYEILAELGRGAMGKVYRARDPIVGREVAIKSLNLEEFPKRQQEEILGRFRREAQAAGQLNHPNIVTIFDVGESFFVMELVKGETLQARVAGKKPLSLEETLGVVAPIAAALDYAHKRGVVHRDVKPANIMLTDRGVPKLMDFGLAHLDTTVLTRAGQSLGSPAYMAPEQIQGIEPTPRADLYALAVVTYEMLTGARPFAGKNITTLLHQVVHESPLPPRHFNAALPPRYDELFERALAKVPEERFSDAADFVTELNLKELEAIVSLLDVPQPSTRRRTVAVLEASEEGDTLATVQTALRPSASTTERRTRPTAPTRGRRSLLAAPAALVLGVAAWLFWPAPASSPLEVDSSPSGATVWVDGVAVGATPVTLEDLSPGEHEIAVVKEGFVRATEVVTPAPDTLPLVFALQPARALLSIASTPSPAAVLVDGKEVGRTPLAELALEEGIHQVEVRHPGHESFRTRVEARLGESLHYVARLNPVAAPRPASKTPESAPPPRVAELGEPGVNPPRKISGEFARYPEAARKRKVSGIVTVSMVISETGVPEELQVVESGGPILDEAVLKAVSEWRFEPPSRDGRPVRLRYRIRQHFRLES